MQFNFADEPVPLDEVEPAAEIVRRFATGAMSFGSISREAHTTLAIAMNRIGGKSNTGEGGEEAAALQAAAERRLDALGDQAGGLGPVRRHHRIPGQCRRPADQDGAGRQARRRRAIARPQGRQDDRQGALLDPRRRPDFAAAAPRHLFDRGSGAADPRSEKRQSAAPISVKLVSEVGVGTVAAGVSKARADHVTIAGFEGGTGASPLTSLTHAGSPWEIGLAETQQTLVRNGLRGRIAVQVDGGLRTGRDVVVGALLGADEFGFATAPLIAAGCIMMRKCHLNTCPVGIATQDPVLRKHFTGQPEHVINYFFFVAEEVRELMAQLGFRNFDEMVGRVDRLDMVPAIDHWKAKGIDLSRLLYRSRQARGRDLSLRAAGPRSRQGARQRVDRRGRPALEERQPVRIERPIRNVHRTVGAMLSGEVALRYGHAGLPEDTTGRAQRQCRTELWRLSGARRDARTYGDANDYVPSSSAGARGHQAAHRRGTRPSCPMSRCRRIAARDLDQVVIAGDGPEAGALALVLPRDRRLAAEPPERPREDLGDVVLGIAEIDSRRQPELAGFSRRSVGGRRRLRALHASPGNDQACRSLIKFSVGGGPCAVARALRSIRAGAPRPIDEAALAGDRRRVQGSPCMTVASSGALAK